MRLGDISSFAEWKAEDNEEHQGRTKAKGHGTAD